MLSSSPRICIYYYYYHFKFFFFIQLLTSNFLILFFRVVVRGACLGLSVIVKITRASTKEININSMEF